MLFFVRNGIMAPCFNNPQRSFRGLPPSPAQTFRRFAQRLHVGVRRHDRPSGARRPLEVGLHLGQLDRHKDESQPREPPQPRSLQTALFHGALWGRERRTSY